MSALDRIVASIEEPALVAEALAELVADVPAPTRRSLPPLRKVPPAPTKAEASARKPAPASRPLPAPPAAGRPEASAHGAAGPGA
ncbi:hypothetical protein AAII07_31905 [Microvirga sp. 0TCS3.31]